MTFVREVVIVLLLVKHVFFEFELSPRFACWWHSKILIYINKTEVCISVSYIVYSRNRQVDYDFFWNKGNNIDYFCWRRFIPETVLYAIFCIRKRSIVEKVTTTIKPSRNSAAKDSKYRHRRADIKPPIEIHPPKSRTWSHRQH